MKRLFGFIVGRHRRRTCYFTQLQSYVVQYNRSSLYGASIAFEAFLVVYGIWSAFAFHSPMLTAFYLLFLALNTALMSVVIFCKRKGTGSFRGIETACFLYIGLTLGFTICISVFPFPDRPAIFFPLAYSLMIVLFQVPIWKLSCMMTGMTALFIALVCIFKTPVACAYDITGAVTTWLLNFVVLYVVSDLHLQNGETRMKLEYQSRTDHLTGLPNRRAMETFLNVTYRRCVHLRQPVAAIMLDVDEFKKFNDSYGHAAGDACLAHIGAVLRAFVEDTGFYAARYGGEEFLLLLAGCEETEAVWHAETLLEKVRYRSEDGSLVTVSMGVAGEIPREGGSGADLVQRADQALYCAKKRGRNQVRLYDGISCRRCGAEEACSIG